MHALVSFVRPAARGVSCAAFHHAFLYPIPSSLALSLQSINDVGPFKVKHVYKTVVEEKNGAKVRLFSINSLSLLRMLLITVVASPGVCVCVGEQKEKKVYDSFKLAIGDTRGFTGYKNGGVLTQVRLFSRVCCAVLCCARLCPYAPGVACWSGLLISLPPSLHMSGVCVIGSIRMTRAQVKKPVQCSYRTLADNLAQV